QRADKPGGLPLVAAVPAVGVVAVVAAGVVKVMIGAGVVMVAEAEQAQQELAHQERAAHEGAAEVDRLVHGAPSPGGGTRTAPVRSGKVLIRGSRMRWESGSRSPAYSLLAADFTRFGGKKHVKKLCGLVGSHARCRAGAALPACPALRRRRLGRGRTRWKGLGAPCTPGLTRP